MKKITLIIGYLFLVLGSIALANKINKNNMVNKDYQKLWTSVEQKEKDDLPKSAIKDVDKILQKAISEKNTSEAIKALIYKSKFESKINNDDILSIFSGLESLLSTTKDNTDKSLLNSLLAELYKNYYYANMSDISVRTNIVDYVPQDIKEWSTNIFTDKIVQHLNESVKDEKSLLKVNPDKYHSIINLGDDSEYIFPTMYDFLLNRAISISQEGFINEQASSYTKTLRELNYTLEDLALPGSKFINLQFPSKGNLIPLFYISTLLKSLESRNMKEAIVFTELKRNNYLQATFPAFTNKYSLSFLESLIQEYSSYDYSVEIINDIIKQLGNSYSYENGITVENTEQLKKIYTLVTDGIDRFPNYKRINLLKDRLANLEESKMSLEGKKTYYPSDKKQFNIIYKNINKASLMILDENNNVVWKNDLTFSPQTSYLLYDENPINVDIKKEGIYTFKFTYSNSNNANKIDSLIFKISTLASFNRSVGDNKYEVYVVDSKNGTPISGAKVNFFRQEWSNGKNTYIPIGKPISTDNNGFAKYTIDSDKNQYYVFYTVSKENDNVKNYIGVYSRYWNGDTPSDKDQIRIFTDRNIYRPGQTIYFKTIVSETNTLSGNQSPITNKKYTVEFLDANYQKISEQTLTTNDFGSIAGEFIIPKGGLTGNYRIKVEDQQIWFKVEEYKRPTFDITFDPIEGTYTFGDSVTITGQVKSFSGIELQNLNVNFSIDKNPLYRFWGFAYGQTDNLNDGLVKTDNNGKFKITFKISQEEQPTNSSMWWTPNIYNYKILATVTNINGETQTGYTNFKAGNVSMMITCNLPDKIEKSSDLKVDIKAQNLSGQDLEVKGTYTIYSVLENDSIDKKILNGNFVTGSQKELQSKILGLSSGKYSLQLETKDDQNRSVKSKVLFTLYSYNDSKPPYYTNDWLVTKSDVFSENQQAQITFGISAKDITVLYELIKENNILSRKQIKLNNENMQFNIPYQKEYGEGIVASFTYIIDGVYFVRSTNINKKEENKVLAIKWKSFRDKIRPGDKEEWSMIINRPDGTPASAELLASMYDASLDKLSRIDTWQSLATYKSSVWANLMSFTNVYNSASAHSAISKEYYPTPTLSWSSFNWFNLYFPNSSRLYMMERSAPSTYVMKAKTEAAGSVASSDVMTNESVAEVKQMAPQVPIPSAMQSSQVQKAEPQIRSSFAETAFFYPQIKTNSEGEAIISFIVPESNTTWNFRALAYNKSFDYASLEATVISQKELMITPNLPRFFRQGDEASISTAISNLSDKNINGKVYVEFFDPITDSLLNIKIDNQYQSFSLSEGASSNATWLFNVPENIDVLGCRVVAESPSYSDGEQQAIVVLPNKMLVTESMPIDINGSETKDFNFDALLSSKSNTLSNYRVTLEYANNPAWYAIQALPTLSNPKDNNSIANFASYYVNTLGLSITQRYPKVTAMIKAWKAQGGTNKTLISQLQKNEELKAVFLEETPWVLDAKNETDQMERLSLLFNLNNINQQKFQALQQLSDLQNENGGWSWFKGMYSNRSVTQYILYGFAELINIGTIEYGEKEKMMQISALKYIDKQIVEDYDSLTKEGRKKLTSIPTSALEYLFVRSSYRDIPISQEARQAECFYTKVAENNWTKLNLYQRSLLVVIAKRNGNKTLVGKLIASLKEKATVNEQQGMFWANNNSTAFMSQSAVSVHTFIMNAFKEYGISDKDIDLMKQWLLSQKQIQQWASIHATIDAINALLSTGADWFSTDSNVKILVNKQQVETSKTELGTGYIQKVWMGDQISNKLGNININRTGEGPAWGAMYWQYYEDLSKIKASKGDLNIDKKLFIEANNTLSPITKDNVLKVGDKVTIRLTVRSDRDMDFVMLKDQRASCFEPIDVLSGIEYSNGIWYYQSTLDASTNYFFDHLPKGTYVFEYSVFVNRIGEYANGITTLQSMYAPQFVSHTEGTSVHVK